MDTSRVCSLLSSVTAPYWIISGWAIDLAVGRVTHELPGQAARVPAAMRGSRARTACGRGRA
jgi:hypothetical protein